MEEMEKMLNGEDLN